MSTKRLAVLFEHPTWQLPLFEALEKAEVPFVAYDLKKAAFDGTSEPIAPLIFNQASPSAYLRGHGRAVPYALAFMKHQEAMGARVLNGAAAFQLELSKIAQVRLMASLGMDYPWSFAFNDPSALREHAEALRFPAILKPNQGGSGARMAEVGSLEEVEALLADDPSFWEPDPILLLQEKLDHDPERQGVVRLEILGGELLYAMRVTGAVGFNLCPSEDCNPEDGTDGACALPGTQPAAGPTFTPYPEVPAEAVAEATRLFKAAGLDVGGLEYLVTSDGRRVFYDVNANSNLRRPVGLAMGFDPFDRVAAWLKSQLAHH